MNHRSLLPLIALLAWRLDAAPPTTPRAVVIIYADDLGYGDVGSYGARRVATPNIDRLAARGLQFTQAYATSSTCTPSRYSLLTGEYAWRRDGTQVLSGDAALIIPDGRATLASILQSAGYRTGVVGKWHLGLGRSGEPLDWNRPIPAGPREVGFDYSFIMAATGDRVPCVYLENQQVVGLDPADPLRVDYKQPFPGEPTGQSDRAKLRMNWSHQHNQGVVNGISRIGYYSGGRAAQWRDEDMADTFTRRAVDFIHREQARPFFLYFAPHDIHVPRAPHARFVGKSGMGLRGDSIVQLDWEVGEIMAVLERNGLSDDTLVIFSSDNGPVLDDGYQDRAVELLGDHQPGGVFRGGKYSRYEAGTRVPLVVCWPQRIRPGISDALVSQVDFLATLAALTGQPLAESDAPDSFNLLQAILGDASQGREYVVEHSGRLALREGRWKYVAPAEGPAVNLNKNIETANSPVAQLYDLEQDPGEKNNLVGVETERVTAMAEKLAALEQEGRTRH
jgi:arylsulfatase A-like enzyme